MKTNIFVNYKNEKLELVRFDDNDEPSRIWLVNADGKELYLSYPDCFESESAIPSNEESKEYFDECRDNLNRGLPIRDLIEEQKKTLNLKKQMNKIQSKVEGNNLIFKCTYCDGGYDGVHIGFNGICSPEVRANNLSGKTPAPYCQLSYCADPTKQKCYECKMLKDWRCLAGRDTSKPTDDARRMKFAKSGFLSFLKTKYPKAKTDIIFAFFINTKAFIGDRALDKEGYVECDNTNLRFELTVKEAMQMPMSNWYSPNDFLSGLYRQIDNDVALDILESAKNIVEPQERKDKVQYIINYFKKLHCIK